MDVFRCVDFEIVEMIVEKVYFLFVLLISCIEVIFCCVDCLYIKEYEKGIYNNDKIVIKV